MTTSHGASTIAGEYITFGSVHALRSTTIRTITIAVVATVIMTLSSCTSVMLSSPTIPVETTPPSEVAALVSPTPTPTVIAAPALTSCDQIITPEFARSVAANGWVGWNMVGQAIGHSPFDAFPGGAPSGQLSCRFGSGPEIATDNVIDLAWAPIHGDSARDAQEFLTTQGFHRINVTDGVQYAYPGEAGWADKEGWGRTYLFTESDVRWAAVRDELSNISPAR